MTTSMNEATNYVHDFVVNYEPTYIALCHAKALHQNGEATKAEVYMIEAVARYYRAMGLVLFDLVDVDYEEMIRWEIENS